MSSPRIPLIANLKNVSLYYRLKNIDKVILAVCDTVEMMQSQGWTGFRGIVSELELKHTFSDPDIVPLEVELAGSWGSEHFAHRLDTNGLSKEEQRAFLRCKDQPIRIQPWRDGYLIHSVKEDPT